MHPRETNILDCFSGPKIISSNLSMHHFFISKQKELLGCGDNSQGSLGIG